MLESDIKWAKQKLMKEHFDSFIEYTAEIELKIESKYKSKNTPNFKRLVELKLCSIAKQNVINLSSYKPDEKELYA